MFLTRKTCRVINGLTIAYCVLGALFLMLAGLAALLDVESRILVRFGILVIAFGFILRPVMRYSLGTNKLIVSANKLVYHKLCPAEFIRLYIQKRDCPDNVVAKPDYTVLNLLTVAYDVLGDTEHALETLDQMILIAPERKKAYTMLLKASILYSNGNIAEADQLYAEALQQKMDMAARATADLVLKSDKAMAVGDFATAEAFFRQLLERRFPKNPPLSVLVAKFALGKICAATGREDEAGAYFTYCVRNGGQTGMQREAEQLLLTQ